MELTFVQSGLVNGVLKYEPPINNAGGNRSGTLVFHQGTVVSSGAGPIPEAHFIERSDLFSFFFSFFPGVVGIQASVCSDWARAHLVEASRRWAAFNGHLES